MGGRLEQGFSFAPSLDDALDLLGRTRRRTVERKGLGDGLLQLDRDVIAGALGHPIDGAGVGIIHPRVDLEAVTLARAIFPGRGTQIAQCQLALAAVEFGDLPEFGGVAFAGAAGEIIEDASARAVDRVVSARFYHAELVELLMRQERSSCLALDPPV